VDDSGEGGTEIVSEAPAASNGALSCALGEPLTGDAPLGVDGRGGVHMPGASRARAASVAAAAPLSDMGVRGRPVGGSARPMAGEEGLEGARCGAAAKSRRIWQSSATAAAGRSSSPRLSARRSPVVTNAVCSQALPSAAPPTRASALSSSLTSPCASGAVEGGQAYSASAPARDTRASRLHGSSSAAPVAALRCHIRSVGGTALAGSRIRASVSRSGTDEGASSRVRWAAK
jgi:hypothetical protein